MSLRDDLAQHIRHVDGGNRMDPHALGWAIEEFVRPKAPDPNMFGADIVLFVQRVNPDKAMGAAALADAIVDHFNLDQED